MADRGPSIGELRWLVFIAARVQSPAGPDTVAEALQDVLMARADIRPLAPMTFLAGQQTDRPVTHRMFIRWLDWLDTTFVVVRRTLRLDRTERLEVYRIRRVGEVGGRKRFLELLVEQELRE